MCGERLRNPRRRGVLGAVCGEGDSDADQQADAGGCGDEGGG
jgi:hypothetical protein